MSWFEQILDELAGLPGIGYAPNGQAAAEPTALAALAFSAHGRIDAAHQAALSLMAMQQSSGMVGVRPGEDSPGWPTSLAVVAWTSVNREQFRPNTDIAVTWLLANRGRGMKQSPDFGHNTELVGWAYAEDTHSWVEPTAFAVLALKSVGKSVDPAAREGASLLTDRQLPGGGLNYGNTYVLGQLIRPHIQPTGVGLLALAGEPDSEGRIAKSIAWLRRNLGPTTTPQSLAWGLLGLQSHGVQIANADNWLAQAARQVQARDRSPYKLALLALAAKGWPA